MGSAKSIVASAIDLLTGSSLLYPSNTHPVAGAVGGAFQQWRSWKCIDDKHVALSSVSYTSELFPCLVLDSGLSRETGLHSSVQSPEPPGSLISVIVTVTPDFSDKGRMGRVLQKAIRT